MAKIQILLLLNLALTKMKEEALDFLLIQPRGAELALRNT
jgi:hypothetical protein